MQTLFSNIVTLSEEITLNSTNWPLCMFIVINAFPRSIKTISTIPRKVPIDGLSYKANTIPNCLINVISYLMQKKVSKIYITDVKSWKFKISSNYHILTVMSPLEYCEVQLRNGEVITLPTGSILFLPSSVEEYAVISKQTATVIVFI